MRDLGVELGNKAKEMLKNLKEKAKDYWTKLLDKLTKEKRSVYDLDALFAE